MSRRTPQRVEPPLDLASPGVTIAAMLAAVVGYFVAEGALAGLAHPLHWLAALAAGGLGYGMAALWLWKTRGKG